MGSFARLHKAAKPGFKFAEFSIAGSRTLWKEHDNLAAFSAFQHFLDAGQADAFAVNRDGVQRTGDEPENQALTQSGPRDKVHPSLVTLPNKCRIKKALVVGEDQRPAFGGEVIRSIKAKAKEQHRHHTTDPTTESVPGAVGPRTWIHLRIRGGEMKQEWQRQELYDIRPTIPCNLPASLLQVLIPQGIPPEENETGCKANRDPVQQISRKITRNTANRIVGNQPFIRIGDLRPGLVFGISALSSDRDPESRPHTLPLLEI